MLHATFQLLACISLPLRMPTSNFSWFWSPHTMVDGMLIWKYKPDYTKGFFLLTWNLSLVPHAFKINLSSLEYLGFLLSHPTPPPWTLNVRYIELLTAVSYFHVTSLCPCILTGISFLSFCLWQCLVLLRGFPPVPAPLLCVYVFNVPCIHCQYTQ